MQIDSAVSLAPIKPKSLDSIYQMVNELKRKHQVLTEKNQALTEKDQVLREKMKNTSQEKKDWIKYFELLLKNVYQHTTGFATNQEGWTPFHEAVHFGHEKILKIIMDESKEKNPKDANGRTPLHEAATLGIGPFKY